MLLAIDPGPSSSAWILFDRDKGPITFGFIENDRLIDMLPSSEAREMAIEMVACYGLAVGADVFETCKWIGRFVQAWNAGERHTLVYRKDIKMHLCHSMRAKDSNIRQALIDRFGGKDKAIGKKKTPGPLFGVSGHLWSALAVAVYYADTHPEPA